MKIIDGDLYSIEQEIERMKKLEFDSEKTFLVGKIVNLFSSLKRFVEYLSEKLVLQKDAYSNYLIENIVLNSNGFEVNGFRLIILEASLKIEQNKKKLVGDQNDLMRKIIEILQKNIGVFYEKKREELEEREKKILEAMRDF